VRGGWVPFAPLINRAVRRRWPTRSQCTAWRPGVCTWTSSCGSRPPASDLKPSYVSGHVAAGKAEESQVLWVTAPQAASP